MPVVQIILMAVFGVVIIAWGVRLDMKNHKKEKAQRSVPDESRR